MEYHYNEILSGEDGEGIFLRDAFGNSYFIEEYPLTPPISGESLVLTLDLNLQSILEEELKKAIKKTNSDEGTGILMNPKTGEILALAFSSNKKRVTFPVKNRAISDNFEPGSTFKIVACACALEEEIKRPEDKIYAEKGIFNIKGKILHDYKPYEWITFKEALVFSSNIGIAKVTLEIGKENLLEYVEKFGFGEKTGIDLPGESKGYLPSFSKLSDYTLSIFSIGQGVSLTAIQLVTAYAAVVNGGFLMKPYVVKAILDKDGKPEKKFGPTLRRRVISEKTSKILVDFLKEVVSHGTGMEVRIDGLSIGGKTGTAQKPDLLNGGYKDKEFIASFIGFFPADDPKIIGLVTLDNPKGKHFGGQTAGPAFKNIAYKIFSLQKTPFASSEKVIIEKAFEKDGEKDLSLNIKLSKEKFSKVPDVTGLTVREAVLILSDYDIDFRLSGSGVVANQQPEAGTLISSEEICVIKCEPK